MRSSSKRVVVRKVGDSRLETIIESAFILAIVISEEVAKTETSFFTFRVLDT